MARRGTADLPLHSGSAPRWLFSRMEELGGAIAEAIIHEHGPETFLARLADPYWFQALGCVLGFDWHSSGVTTTTMGALKAALDPEEHGVFIAGGKGAASRKTPDEIADGAQALSLGGNHADRLARSSRLSAAVDNGAVQDDFTLYHHTFVVTENGDWSVVQQGMADSMARRYHWLADRLDSYVERPHTAICSMARRDQALDLTAETSAETRATSVDLVNDDPSHLKQYCRGPAQRTLGSFAGEPEVHLSLPDHHALQRTDLTERSIDQLERAYEYGPSDYEELVGLSGIGPASLRALALIAELVYGAESAWTDPAKYAFAHGGKDGTPFPVHRDRYDRSIRQLQATLDGLDVGRSARRDALKRLARFEARAEADAPSGSADD